MIEIFQYNSFVIAPETGKLIVNTALMISDVPPIRRRDLTKQLRQIGRGADEKQKTARKMLPGVAYTNREIEKQETFAEARARVC